MIQKETSDATTAIAKLAFPDRKFDKENLQSLMGLLLEESGELSGAIRTYFGRKYRPELITGNIDNVKGEIGDILVVLNGVCNLFDFTMNDCMLITNKKLNERYVQEQRRVEAASLPPFERIDN